MSVANIVSMSEENPFTFGGEGEESYAGFLRRLDQYYCDQLTTHLFHLAISPRQLVRWFSVDEMLYVQPFRSAEYITINLHGVKNISTIQTLVYEYDKAVVKLRSYAKRNLEQNFIKEECKYLSDESYKLMCEVHKDMFNMEFINCCVDENESIVNGFIRCLNEKACIGQDIEYLRTELTKCSERLEQLSSVLENSLDGQSISAFCSILPMHNVLEVQHA